MKYHEVKTGMKVVTPKSVLSYISTEKGLKALIVGAER